MRFDPQKKKPNFYAVQRRPPPPNGVSSDVSRNLLVQFKVAAGHALCGTFAVTSDGVALGIAIVQDRLSVDGPHGSGLRVRPRAGERRDGRLQKKKTPKIM